MIRQEDRELHTDVMAELIALRQQVRALTTLEAALSAQRELFDNLISAVRSPSQQLPLEITLRKTLEIAARMSQSEHGSLFLFDGDGRSTISIHTRTLDDSERRSVVIKVLDQGLAGWVARRREIAVIEDTLVDSRWLPVNTPFTIRSALSLPILRGDTLLGVLTLVHPEPAHFSSDHAHLIQVTTGHLALVIENARLHTAAQEELRERRRAEDELRRANDQLQSWVRVLEQRAREMTLLNEMGELFQSCLSVDEAYAVAGRAGRQLFSSEHGLLGMLSPATGTVEAAAWWGGLPDSATLFAYEDCWALRRGRVHVSDADDGLRCRHLQGVSQGVALCVPLMAQGETLGLLSVAESTPGTLVEDRRRLAVTAAEHVALSIANLRLHETLRRQSISDALTGLYNRRFFEDLMQRELARADKLGKELALLVVDLDHLKLFNDTYGHDAGDLLLREIGAVLQAHVDKGEHACRYGGEEFVVVLPGASLAEARMRADPIRQAVRALSIVHHGTRLGHVTASVGIAVFPHHGRSLSELFRAADQALYRAKSDGRDQVVFASPLYAAL